MKIIGPTSADRAGLGLHAAVGRDHGGNAGWAQEGRALTGKAEEEGPAGELLGGCMNHLSYTSPANVHS